MPDHETYTVTTHAALKGTTAIRLEALADERLPTAGPGRAKNGNLVLTDVRLTIAPATAPGEAVPLAIRSASADFSQGGFPVAHAIDDRPETGWAIDPEVGKTHAAVFAPEALLA